MKRQQVYWNGAYYLLNKCIPTGSKHAVLLANIFLTPILLDALSTSDDLQRFFDAHIKLWKRFIDDFSGLFHGTITEFLSFFQVLQAAFRKYGLELTCGTDSHSIIDEVICEKSDKFSVFLDMELFKDSGTIHSREHRKDTSANCYIPLRSAHPRHSFPGIIKSQLFRLRRICSKDIDFVIAVERLRNRCLNSGYHKEVIDTILNPATSMERILTNKPERPLADDMNAVRLVVLSGTPYEHDFVEFAKRMNSVLNCKGIKIEIIKSTSVPVSRMLFNNNDNKSAVTPECKNKKCLACRKGLLSNSGEIKSTVSGEKFFVDESINCGNGGIYVVDGACGSQYTGKTVCFSKRLNEHFGSSNQSAIFAHKQECNTCYHTGDFKVTLCENYYKRGKYSLSEREYLWNYRMKGTMNVQKTLKAN